MSLGRPLHGGCQCGRNRYIIEVPEGATDVAQVLFDTAASHRHFQATPLPAFLRVPLAWYRSTTVPFFDDETHPMIHRVYTHHTEQHSKRHFCGFCGTPLSYWSEQPLTEADFIQLTLGSLSRDDLGDLEELGLLPDTDAEPVEEIQEDLKEPPEEAEGEEQEVTLTGRETLSLPWFDTLLAGSRLGNLRTSKGSQLSQDGRTRIEWEVREWTSDDGEQTGSPRKRTKLDTENTPENRDDQQ